jgi:serine/threonine protein phosphatase PrpC
MNASPPTLALLPAGKPLRFNGLELTLGPASEFGAGAWRIGTTADGAVHRVLELPGGELPAWLAQALRVPGVASVTGQRREANRVALALRSPPGPSLEWVLRRAEGLALFDLSLIASLAELFQAIHDAGLCFRAVRAEMFSVDRAGRVHLEEPEALRGPGEAAQGSASMLSAPEVAGGTGDARSDQYSLAALTWALLVGRLPSDHADLPSPRIFRRNLPHGVLTALARAMSEQPAQRYPSCKEFLEDLRARCAPLGQSPGSLELGAATAIGRLKSQQMPVNQDAWFIGHDEKARRAILLVADGVSTADVGSGDLASGFVREAVRNAWEGPVGDILRTHKGALPEDWAKTALEAILEDANARIFAFLKQPIFVGSLAPSTHPPGSTAVLCVLDGDKLSVANVGDSRLYLLRAGALEQMSVDQDLRTEILRAGRDPRAASDPSVLGALTHSVGNFLFDSQGGIGFRPIQPELFVLWIRAGDRLLLCSDGVPDCLGDGYEAVVARELSADAGAEVIAERLCRLADEALGADNITALVLLAR